MRQRKLSFSENSMNFLQQMSERNKIECDSMLDQLMETFKTISNVDQVAIYNYIGNRIEFLHSQQENEDTIELTQLVDAYKKILNFLPSTNGQNREEFNSQMMKRISIKNGCLICPCEWIIVNPEDACEMEYAGVIECRNSLKYNIPHLVFLSNKKYGREYDNSYCEEIHRMCCKAYPRFEEILKMQVEAIPDPSCPGAIKNNVEWLAAPTIGYFSIYVQDDPQFGPYYKPANGARVIHYEKQLKKERLYMRIEENKKKLLTEFANEDYPTINDSNKKLSKLIDSIFQKEIDSRLAKRLLNNEKEV